MEDFTLKHLLVSEIWAREICEKFAYKYSETKYLWQMTRYFLGLRMRNFQIIVFIKTQTYREIFKSALAYL